MRKTSLYSKSYKTLLFKFAVFVGVAFLSLNNICEASISYYWDGSSATVTSGSSPDITVGDLTRVNAGGGLTGTSSPASPGSGGSYFVAAAQSGALSISASTYFQITLTPSSGDSIQFDSISFYSRSTSSGPTAVAVYSSLDSYTTAIGSATVSTSGTWSSLLTFTGDSLAGSADEAVSFRIYGYGGSSASSGNWRVDDITLNVTAVPEPAAWGFGSGAVLLAFCGFQLWRRRGSQNPVLPVR